MKLSHTQTQNIERHLPAVPTHDRVVIIIQELGQGENDNPGVAIYVTRNWKEEKRSTKVLFPDGIRIEKGQGVLDKV